jgi:hypothetical protein
MIRSATRGLSLLAAAGLIGVASIAVAEPFDGFAFRARHGDQAVAAEVARIEAARGAHADDEETALRLASLTVAAGAPSRRAYEARLRRVLADRRRIMGELRTVLNGGPYGTESLNSRWLNSMARTSDADARALFRRVFVDQLAITTRVEGVEAEAYSHLLRVDKERLIRENAEWLKSVLARIGWFDISRYGADASQGAWLLVQHADYDPAFQRAMLKVLGDRVPRGDMQATYYAYLVDRVAVNSGERQTYGTQGRCVPGAGRWEPREVAEPEGLDARRAALGLEPMTAYLARFNCR